MNIYTVLYCKTISICHHLGGAVVNVYSNDGTILINIGGVEMGQGLNTKMMQIAAYTLDVPYDYITVGSTSTDKVMKRLE